MEKLRNTQVYLIARQHPLSILKCFDFNVNLIELMGDFPLKCVICAWHGPNPFLTGDIILSTKAIYTL